MALAVNAAVLAILLLIACPRYQTDMDIVMQAQLYNLRGDGASGHLIFSNIILGVILKGLCSLFPAVAWYTISQYLCIFAALSFMGAIFFRNNQSRMAVLIYSCFVVFAGYECYMLLTYFKTAAILVTAACYLLYYILMEDKHNIVLHALVVAAAVLAGMISWRAALLCGMVGLLGIVAAVAWRAPGHLKNVRWVVVLLLILVGSFVLKELDNRVYERDPGQFVTLVYRDAAEKVGGFGAGSYDDDIRLELGLSKSQYSHLVKGVFTSDQLQALPKLQAIAAMKRQVNAESLLQFFRLVPIRFIKVGSFYCFVILWVFAMQREGEKKKRALFLSIGLLLATYLVLFMLHAWERQVVGALVFLPLCLMALLCCEDIVLQDVKTPLCYLAITGMVLYMNFSDQVVTGTADTPMETYMENNTVAVGLNVMDINKHLRKHSVFEVYTPGIVNRNDLLIINGIYSILPNYQQLTCRLGLEPDSIVYWVGSDGGLRGAVIK